MARPRVRERILDAAQQLLQQEGVRALTTRNVALTAGTTEASVFNNFVDKAGLIRSLVDERIPAVQLLRKTIENRSIETNAWLEQLYLDARCYYLEVMPLYATLLSMAASSANVASLGKFDPHPMLTAAISRRRLLPSDAWEGQAACLASMMLGAAMRDGLGDVMAYRKPAQAEWIAEAHQFALGLAAVLRR